MQKRVQLHMAKKENNFSNKLESFGLSRNHEKLSENTQFIEKITILLRAQPLYPSQVLGDSYQYGSKQLKKKAPHYLENFGIFTEKENCRRNSYGIQRFGENSIIKIKFSYS